jgi:hypothetical protein
MNNVYYDPERFGLKMIDSLDIAGSWEFCMLALWERTEDGALFYATDSGCSCPWPFEWAGVNELTRITSAAEFAAEARKWLRDSYYTVGGGDRTVLARMILTVRTKLREAKSA